MKKLILFILFFASIGAYAQKGNAVKLPTVTGDTVANTGTVVKSLQFTGGYSGVIVEVPLHLISGTGAGTVTLSGSLSGVNFTTIGSAYTITNTANQSAIFYISNPVPSSIKITVAGSGTESLATQFWYRTPIYQTTNSGGN